MKILIGLGNPGKKYENTRHNIGYMMVDYFHERNNFEAWKSSKFDAIISEGTLHGEKIILVKPTTFMNLSGQSIAKILHFYKLDISSEVLVISDDIDMEFGKVRLRAKGSHGGQNGIRNTIERLGTNEFFRLKIGIGRHTHMPVSDWVLSKLSKTETSTLSTDTFDTVEQKIEEFLEV